MNFSEQFDLMPLIARTEAGIRTALRRLDKIDLKLSQCTDEQRKSAYHRKRAEVLRDLKERESLKERYKSMLVRLKDEDFRVETNLPSSAAWSDVSRAEINIGATVTITALSNRTIVRERCLNAFNEPNYPWSGALFAAKSGNITEWYLYS
ncbi:hypothetical protein CAPTEDRAFT_206725 [Capitella teleta]|uniref:Uncharacterized protein n=1 Tax=Capitella teleta TaxID=283909 RepID=R7U3D6_CAPTE|nr:hypothetical protein CAPTEDRAFT_206725 [Capitella teleta]|eukprot:ELT97690.1 hypothetical protein CAPTEDRAFT_206725 [Capitella teleta]